MQSDMRENAFFNGEMVATTEAQVRFHDLGLLRGYGIFDFFLFQQGQPRFLSHYLDRFYRSAGFLGLDIPLARESMADAIAAVIAANGFSDGGIRLLLTGGYAEDSYTPTAPNLAIVQHPLPPAVSQPATSCSLLTYRHQRELPGVKSTNYLTGIYLQPMLRRAGADYLLFHDGQHVSESDRSNFFGIDADGRLLTPDEGVLPGITRMQILEIGRAQGIPVLEAALPLEALPTLREAFLTSTTKGVLPVVTIDGKPVGDGKPGAVSLKLQEGFAALVDRLLHV